MLYSRKFVKLLNSFLFTSKSHCIILFSYFYYYCVMTTKKGNYDWQLKSFCAATLYKNNLKGSRLLSKNILQRERKNVKRDIRVFLFFRKDFKRYILFQLKIHYVTRNCEYFSLLAIPNQVKSRIITINLIFYFTIK